MASTVSSNQRTSMTNGYHSTTMETNHNAEEDQLTQINLQALQNRDPFITKIVDQAQRVCVYKFVAEKREWERKDLEGTLFVYERTCEPYHGFVILSTVSRETFVQIIKPCMEFKHTPTYEAFLQYKVDVGDIYGIWFISKNDCPRVTECLKRLTSKAKEREQSKNVNNQMSIPVVTSPQSNDIFSLLVGAQEKFQEIKRKQDVVNNNSDTTTPMPAALLRLFSTQETTAPSQSTNILTTTVPGNASTSTNGEREQELKKTLGILGKPALSVTELERQLLQPAENNDNLARTMPVASKAPSPPRSPFETSTSIDWAQSHANLFHGFDPIPINNTGRLMTPAEFQTLRIAPSPVLVAPTPIEPPTCCHCQQPATSPRFSKDYLRQLLVDMLQNDEEFITGLHNAYTEKQNGTPPPRRIYS